jgi:fatty acid desaturase
MDHKAFLAGVSPDRRAVLTERSNWPGFVHLALHLGLIGLVGALISLQVPLWWVLLPVQGLLITALFMLTHECTHDTPFKTVWLNRAIGYFAGFWLLLPFRWFRYFHLAHHKWTNIAGKDPELGSAKPNDLVGWLWHVSGLPLWGRLCALLLRLMRNREAPAWLPARARAGAVREARLMGLLYLMVIVAIPFAPVILWVWVVPVLLGQPFLRLYLLAEHGDCPQVANMFENTRTTFTHRAIRWLAWNMPYHAEHHVWPNVPFHKLPALHADMRAHLGQTADGYVTFNRAYLARRLQPNPDVISPKPTK